jgi:hypothetical protein
MNEVVDESMWEDWYEMQRLLRVRDILAAAPEPWEAHLSPENRGALERLGMDVADAAIHRAMQEAK